MNGFWFINNPAIFNNAWDYKDLMTEHMKNYHPLSDAFLLCWASPAILYVLYAWIYKVFALVYSEADMV